MAIAVLVLLLPACRGEREVPADAVAVVDGESVARSDYEALLARARTGYKRQKREFPKAGSREFQTLKNQFVSFLVQRVEFEQKAKELGIEVEEKQIEARLKQIKKQYFGGDEKKYKTQLEQQGLSDKQVRADIRAQIVSEEIFKRVTKEARVEDRAIADYYAKNKTQYSQPETREVRHILVKTRAQANQLYERLKGGADFAALAKKFSQDTGSKGNGGKLTISKGQTVAPFDQTAFLLDEKVISRPIKTEFGFHIIEPLSAVKPAKTTPLEEVRDSIRQQLLQTKKNEAMTKWVDGVKKDYDDNVTYAIGFNPPPAATGTTGSR